MAFSLMATALVMYSGAIQDQKHDYVFEAVFEGESLRGYKIDGRIGLKTVLWEMTVRARQEIASIDDFPDIKVTFAGFEGSRKDLLSFLALHTKLVRHELPETSPKKVAFYNLGDPLSDGEIQVYKLGKSWHVVARNAKLGDVLGKVREGALHGLHRSLGQGLEMRWTGHIASDSGEGLVISLSSETGAFATNYRSQPESDVVVQSWPVTFLGGEVASISDGALKKAPATSSTDLLTDTAEQLSAIYGDTEVTARGRNLFMKGPKDQVAEIKRALATWIDVPYPTVRLDVWAYQGSERKHTSQDMMERVGLINLGVQVVREFGAAYMRDFDRFMSGHRFYPNFGSPMQDAISSEYFNFGLAGMPDENRPTWEQLCLRRERVKPFVDNLAYLAILDRKDFGVEFETFMNSDKAEALATLKSFICDTRARLTEVNRGPAYSDRPRDVEVMGKLIALGNQLYDAAGGTEKLPEDDRRARFRRKPFFTLTHLFERSSAKADCQSLLDFLVAYRSLVKQSDGFSPERLAILASNVDTMIVNATEAITTDVKAATIRPLLDWIDIVSKSGKKGNPTLVLVGNSSVAVTSSRTAVTTAEAVGYMPYTPTKPLDSAAVTSLFGLFQSNPAFSSAGGKELIEALAKFGQQEPVFTSVAPGLGMAVRPTILPGGRLARLEIVLNNAVSVDKPSGEWTGDPIDHVKSQTLDTDVTINTFDLFELSTFSSEHTGLGDRTWRIPVLEGLPFIGNMFRGPRGTVSTVHRAVLVVNATVVPRAMDLARRYVVQD